MAVSTIPASPSTAAAPVPAAGPAAGPKVLAWWRGSNKVDRWGRHVLAILFWTYLTGQIFFDVDLWLHAHLPPEFQWVIDYKVLLFLSVAALILNFVPRRIFWWWSSFILLWPATRALKGLLILGIILFKLKSWPILFAVLNLSFAIVRSFKINFLLYIAALIAIMTTLLSHSIISLNSAAIVLVVITLVLVARRLVAIFQPSPIFNVYVRALAWMMDYSRRKLIKPPDVIALDASGINLPEPEKRYSELSTAVMLIELCGFFQAKFREYRNSGMAIANYLLILATLFLLVVVLLGFANLGIYRADPATFKISGGHTLFDFLYYTFGAISAQRSGEIVPILLGAKLLSMLEMSLYWLIAAGTLLALFLAIRRGRDDEAVEKAVIRLQEEEQRMGQFIEEKFALPMDQAIATLEGVQGGLVNFISVLRAARRGL